MEKVTPAKSGEKRTEHVKLREDAFYMHVLGTSSACLQYVAGKIILEEIGMILDIL